MYKTIERKYSHVSGEVLQTAAGLPRGAGPRTQPDQDQAPPRAQEDPPHPVQGARGGERRQGPARLEAQ